MEFIMVIGRLVFAALIGYILSEEAGKGQGFGTYVYNRVEKVVLKYRELRA